MGNLIRITLNPLIGLGSIAILTISSLPIQEHGMSLYFFESFLISLLMFYSSQHIGLSSPWSGLFLSIFFRLK